MFMLGPIGFLVPWLLAALVVLPVLWLLLRAVPPAPIRRRFPGVALLLGLTDDETQTDKTPWWLLLLRMLAVAALIVGFAGPVLNPEPETAGKGPLLVLVDGSWADARDWSRRVARIEAQLNEAARNARPAAIVSLSDLPVGGVQFQAADAALASLPSLQPKPWQPAEDKVLAWLDEIGAVDFDTFWMSDGLDRVERSAVLAELEKRGNVRVFESPSQILALRPAGYRDGAVQIEALRTVATSQGEASVSAFGLDPGGIERPLARTTIAFDAGSLEANATLDLPPELRNRVTRFEIEGVRSAGAVSLTDDALKRREIALIAGRDEREGLQLLAPLHYLDQALRQNADLIDGSMDDIVLANPDVIIMADVARVPQDEVVPLLEWIEKGGVLVRFAGPRLAASDVSRNEEDPLMPVRLRVGGRMVGGAMSWGEPKGLRSFSEGSPFFGLPVPKDVTVNAQVMAQPDPTLSERVIASLVDGTPLVTRKRQGAGQIVLFHVTANAEWSSLPLSGLFVQMLERLSIAAQNGPLSEADLEGSIWVPDRVLDGFGRVLDAGTMPGVPGEDIATAAIGPDMPPGLYRDDERQIALNTIRADTEIAATSWPARIIVEGLAVARERPLKGMVLAAALAALALDVLASLWLSGRLFGPRARSAAMSVAVALACVTLGSDRAQAQQDADAIRATSKLVLAHVITGDSKIDATTAAGLRQLGNVLFSRTSIEPDAPIALDLEADELSFYPFLYWPVSTDQPVPSAAAYARLNEYLRTGGMILFDTRDADVSQYGSTSPEGRKLQELARRLDIPPLEQVPEDHVLTRAFYLLQGFPGRYASTQVWVEASPPDAERVEGMPFRNLNDNVTPVIIGGNDWAAAWAADELGNYMLPVGRGYAGERQRELALRFGVNLIMHVLTGNYKSDQVHVPALLDRLGQ